MARKLKGKSRKHKGANWKKRQPKPVVLAKKSKAANRRRDESRKPKHKAYAVGEMGPHVEGCHNLNIESDKYGEPCNCKAAAVETISCDECGNDVPTDAIYIIPDERTVCKECSDTYLDSMEPGPAELA